MQLRRQILFIALLAFLLPALLVLMLARDVLLGEFARLEQQHARLSAEQAAGVVANDLASLRDHAVDWAHWDDTYAFIQTQDSDYIESNLVESTFTGLQVNFIAFIDASGQLVNANAYDLRLGSSVAFPGSLSQHFAPGSPLLAFSGPDDLHSGLLLLPEGPLELISLPILPSDLAGPPRGTFVIARYLDQDRMAYLSDVVSLPIRLITGSELVSAPAAQALASGEFMAQPVDKQNIAGYAALDDIYRRERVVIMIEQPRDAYNEAYNSIVFYVGILMVATIGFLGIGWLLVDRKVNRRIVDLSRRMAKIGVNGSKSERLPVRGKDEIAELSDTFNAMLDGLQRSESALRQSEQRYRDIVEAQTELVCRWNPDGALTFVNEAFCSYFGRSREALIGQNFYAMFPNEGPGLGEYVALLNREGCQQVSEQCLWLPGGGESWQQWIDLPLFEPSGDADGGLQASPQARPQGGPQGGPQGSPEGGPHGGLVEVLSVGRVITARIHLERALKRRVEFERLVTEISSRLINVTAIDSDQQINQMLQIIGEFSGVDRSYIFFFEGEQMIMRNAFEWCAEGIEPQIQNLQAIPLSDLPWHWEKTRRFETIYVPSVADLPPEAALEKAHFQAQDIQSMLTVPMVSGRELKGFLGFDSVRSQHEWTDESIQLLKLVADSLTGALVRLESEKRLLAQQSRLRLLNEITRLGLVAPDESAVLEISAGRIAEFLGAEACLITLWDEENERLAHAAAGGPAARRVLAWLGGGQALGALLADLKTRGQLVLNDLGKASFRTRFAPGPFQGMLGVPLVLSESERGGLFVFFRQQRPFDSGELMLCEQIASHISLVVLKIKALAAAQQGLAEAETLRAAVSLIAATLRPAEAVSRILDQLQSVVPYDSASIQILHDGSLEIIGGSGWDEPEAVRGVCFPVPGDNPNTRVIQEQSPVILDEAPLYYPNFRNPPHDHINSWLGVPLVVRGNVIGMLAIDKNEPYFYQPHHLRLVLAFADQVAVSLENARLYESEHQRALELDALRATVADVIAKLDMPTLLRSIVERAASLLDATGGEIGRFDEERQQLQIEISYNLGMDFKGEWISLGEGVMGHVAETLEPYVVDDYTDWEGRSRRYDQVQLRGAVAAPMVIGGRLLGVIGVGTNDPYRHYTSSDLTLLNLFAQQAAIAVENARLFDEIQNQAITDMVTGLYNRRGLFEFGEREVLRSLRSERPISVIMFDIDHFKRVNDRHSHAVGDQVLRWLAGMGSVSLRKTDILARYGGEEFAILLPETTLEDAQRIAERFRNAVAETPVETTHGAIHITISCGVTCAAVDVPELAVLLDQADTALYLAKQEGRNRTEVFTAEAAI